MTLAYTDVPWRGRIRREKVWTSVKGPADSGEVDVERLSLDIPVRDYDFLESFALFRNLYAEEERRKLLKRWSRKSMAESLLLDQVRLLREQLEEMFKAMGGEFPKIDSTTEATKKASREAMRKYVQRVQAWDKKSGSK